MLRVFARRARLALQRLHAHAFYQRRHVLEPDLDSLLGKQIAHTRACERHLQVKSIKAIH